MSIIHVGDIVIDKFAEIVSDVGLIETVLLGKYLKVVSCTRG